MSGGGEHLKDEGTKKQVVLAGGIAGLVSRFCVAPLDVVKIRLQLQIHSLSDPASHRGVTGPIYKGTIPTMRAIVREEGLTGLWKGNIPAELLYICYGGVQFVTYRSTTQALSRLPRRLPSSVESFVSGAVAGGIATAATYPLDLLRTRFAAQGNERIYASLLASIRDIARHEGPSGFFRGCSAAVGQIVPYMGLFFATYEALRPAFLAFDHLPFGSGDAAAGMLASVLAKTGVFPLDLVRKRLQVQGPTRGRYVHRNIPEYRGVFNTIATILRTQGLRGLYRGLTVSLFKAAPASAVTMWTYERALKVLREMDID
ncbi:mitochondrial thiamine pyrophosphate carrier 1 [Thermoascus aurantiacus ATCC 26904]